jgi:hypothetical protein
MALLGSHFPSRKKNNQNVYKDEYYEYSTTIIPSPTTTSLFLDIVCFSFFFSLRLFVLLFSFVCSSDSLPPTNGIIIKKKFGLLYQQPPRVALARTHFHRLNNRWGIYVIHRRVVGGPADRSPRPFPVST